MGVHLRNFLDMKNAKVSVAITNDLKDKIKEKIQGKIYIIAKKLRITPARLYDYFIEQKLIIPLEVLFSIANMFNISEKDIENNIIFYKQLHVPSKNSIKTPKLPIEVNPYFTSLIANLFFDGSVPEDGKGVYYNQKSKEIMGDFINKSKIIFGGVSYSIKLDHRGVIKCRMPRLIGEICRHVYEIEHFGTFKSVIPEKIFSLSLEHKQAFVLTGIIDEGSIAYDGSVIFGVSNLELIRGFKKLCQDIGLTTTEIKNKKNSSHYYIYITSVNKLLEIVSTLKKEYPLINLRYKEERLIKSIEIKSQSQNSKEFNELIFKELRNKKLSVNFLSSKLLITPRTIRYNLYKLIKENKIKREKIGNEYIYFSQIY